MDKKEIARDTATSMFIALFIVFCFYLIKGLGSYVGLPTYPSELVPAWLTVPSGKLETHLFESLTESVKVYFFYLGLPMLLGAIMGPAFGVNERISHIILGMLFLAFVLYLTLTKYNPEQVPAIYMFGIALFRLIIGIEYIFLWKAEGLAGLIQSTIYVAITNLLLYTCGFILKISGLG